MSLDQKNMKLCKCAVLSIKCSFNESFDLEFEMKKKSLKNRPIGSKNNCSLNYLFNHLRIKKMIVLRVENPAFYYLESIGES